MQRLSSDGEESFRRNAESWKVIVDAAHEERGVTLTPYQTALIYDVFLSRWKPNSFGMTPIEAEQRRAHQMEHWKHDVAECLCQVLEKCKGRDVGLILECGDPHLLVEQVVAAVRMVFKPPFAGTCFRHLVLSDYNFPDMVEAFTGGPKYGRGLFTETVMDLQDEGGGLLLCSDLEKASLLWKYLAKKLPRDCDQVCLVLVGGYLPYECRLREAKQFYGGITPSRPHFGFWPTYEQLPFLRPL